MTAPDPERQMSKDECSDASGVTLEQFSVQPAVLQSLCFLRFSGCTGSFGGAIGKCRCAILIRAGRRHGLDCGIAVKIEQITKEAER